MEKPRPTANVLSLYFLSYDKKDQCVLNVIAGKREKNRRCLFMIAQQIGNLWKGPIYRQILE